MSISLISETVPLRRANIFCSLKELANLYKIMQALRYEFLFILTSESFRPDLLAFSERMLLPMESELVADCTIVFEVDTLIGKSPSYC